MPTKNDHKDHPVLGMACALGAFIIFSTMQVFAKLLSDTHHVVEIVFYRNFIAVLPFFILIFIMKRHQILKIEERPKMTIFRAVLGLGSTITTFWALSLMPIADTTAFLFTSSLFIPILSIIILDEKVRHHRWIAIIIGFIGVLIMLSPNGDINLFGALIALVAAFLHAVLGIVLRLLGKSEKPETVTFYFFLTGTILTAFALPFVFTPISPNELLYIAGLGLSALTAQFLLTIAYKNAEASIVTIFNYTGIIWASLFGWLIWNDWPALTIWIGGAIVIMCNIFIIWRESHLRKMTGARTKAEF